MTLAEYHERLRVPGRWWLQCAAALGTWWIAMAVALPSSVTWGVTAACSVMAAISLLRYGAANVQVSDQSLTAGRARIGTQHLRSVEALEPDRMRNIGGPGADARAYLLLRPYIKGGVRVELCDPADPTPYWLVSSRRPELLAQALRSAIAVNEGGTATVSHRDAAVTPAEWPPPALGA